LPWQIKQDGKLGIKKGTTESQKRAQNPDGRSVMKKMVRCKACGYIMEEGKLGDKCPACGAPKTAFLPFDDPVSPARRNRLKLDLHPMAVHFPVSFAVAALVFAIATALFSGDTRTLLISTTKIIVLLFPFLIIIAGIVGFVDGRVRFRKIKNSLILKKKILYAVMLFIVSVVLAVIVWIFGFDKGIFTLVAVLLAAISVSLIIALALLGTSISEAAFPG
jgi:uncharacterized membrane protein